MPRIPATLLLALILPALGCPTPGAFAPATADPAEAREAVLPAAEGLNPDVVLVEDHPCFEGVDVPADREVLTFEFACGPVESGIEPGRVVVGLTGGGYLRRVVSVAVDGDLLTAWTEPATLAEALDEGSFTISIADPGERAVIDLGGTTFHAEEGPAEVVARIPSGYLDLDPKIDLDGHWSGGRVQRFDIELSLGFEGDLELYLASNNGIRLRDSVGVYETSWPFAFMVGPLPVAGSVGLRVKAGFHARAEGSVELTLGAGGSAELSTAKHYTAEGGWTEDEDARFDWEAREPVLETGAKASIQGYLRASPTVTLYGVAGPEFNVDLWTRAKASPECEGLDWEIDGGLRAAAKVHFTVFDRWSVSKTFARFDFTADLGDGTLPWPVDFDNPCTLEEIECGRFVTGDTSTAEYAPMLDGYSCNVGSYAAPEAAFLWTAPATGPVTWRLVDPEPTSVNHDVMVLNAAGDFVEADCLHWGSNAVEFQAVAGASYYLVVDGYDTDAGPFEAALECSSAFDDDGADDLLGPIGL